jgi:hypothetical protein
MDVASAATFTVLLIIKVIERMGERKFQYGWLARDTFTPGEREQSTLFSIT